MKFVPLFTVILINETDFLISRQRPLNITSFVLRHQVTWSACVDDFFCFVFLSHQCSWSSCCSAAVDSIYTCSFHVFQLFFQTIFLYIFSCHSLFFVVSLYGFIQHISTWLLVTRLHFRSDRSSVLLSHFLLQAFLLLAAEDDIMLTLCFLATVSCVLWWLITCSRWLTQKPSVTCSGGWGPAHCSDVTSVLCVFRLRGRGGPQEVLWFPDPAPRAAERLTLGGRLTGRLAERRAEQPTGQPTLAGPMLTLPPPQWPLTSWTTQRTVSTDQCSLLLISFIRPDQ